MLAPCGINCAECTAFKATMTADESMMGKVVETFGGGEGSLTDWVCLGCLHPEPGLIADYCAGCGIRGCAVERGVGSCAACDQYEGCEKLKVFFSEEGAPDRKRLDLLREAFVVRTQPAD